MRLRRHRSMGKWTRAGVVLGAALFAAMSVWAAPASAAWRAISGPQATVRGVPALYRDKQGALHVVTVDREEAGSNMRLMHTQLNAAGVPSTTADELFGDFLNMNSAALLPDPAGMRVYFSGRRSGQTGDALATTQLYTATSADAGDTWTFDAAMSNFTGRHVGDVSAVLDASGVPVTTWSNLQGVWAHIGTAPAHGNLEDGTLANEFNNVGSCCGYSPNVGVDRATKKTWIGYRSNEIGRVKIFLRPIGPGAPGKRFALPLSEGSEVDGPLPMATQAGGARKLWVAWCARTRAGCTKVSVLRASDKRRIDVATMRGNDRATKVGITAGAGGRMWVWWATNRGIFYTRSNPAMTRFDPPKQLGLLGGNRGFWRIDGAAAPGGKLDLIATFTKDAQVTRLYHRRVTL